MSDGLPQPNTGEDSGRSGRQTLAVNLWTLLERAASSHPRRIAAVDGALRLSYAELRRRAAGVAAGLRQAGVARGDRVAILELNSVAYLEAYFATAALGAILVPLGTRLAAPELARILRHADARVLLARGEFADLVRRLEEHGTPVELLAWTDSEGLSLSRRTLSLEACRGLDGRDFRCEPVAPEHVAQIYYTSGTTGVPKGVMLTHGNVAWHALGACAELSLDDRDVWFHVAPMFHLADAWACFAITWVAGTHVFTPRFEESRVLELLAAEGITLTNLVPTMLQRLIAVPDAARRRYPGLRRILSGGAPIAPAVVRRIVDTFHCEYVQTYGMTETSPFLTLSLLKEHLRREPPEVQFAYRAKTGRPFVTVELAVVGDDGRPVAADGATVGEIRARGPTVTPGYWNDPEATARAFVDGWLCTGDLATLDAEGYLQIVDRKKDMIISGGEKVYSTDVESVLYAHPAVLECAVFGVPDAQWGERVEAAVVLRQGADLDVDALLLHARQQLAAYKVPRRIRLLDELPKTGSGKILKGPLRNAPC